jgi:hypothetical protein
MILFVGASYVRFIILDDYYVIYEIDCDPSLDSCFIGCSDDECTEEYPYYTVEKYATDIVKQCGESIESCTSAESCLADDGGRCQVTYCIEDEENTCWPNTLENDQTEETNEYLVL